MNQPKNMSNLPPEILIPIFVQLPIKDLVNLSKTCKRLNDIFEDELVWEQKVLLEYDINLKRMKEQSYKAEHNCIPKDLYRLLHKYGKLLGMWHRKYGPSPRGSVYQVLILIYIILPNRFDYIKYTYYYLITLLAGCL